MMSNYGGLERRQLSGPLDSSQDLETLSAEDRAAAEKFDASQYAFFGHDVGQEELGGLDDEEDAEQLGGLEEDDYGLPSIGDKDEVDPLDIVSESDTMAELSNSFSRLNRLPTPGENRLSRSIGDLGPEPRDYGSNSDILREADVSSWIDQQLLEPPDIEQVARQLWPSHQAGIQRAPESPKPLYRHSSYPPQQWSGDSDIHQSSVSSNPQRFPQNQPRHRSSPGPASQMMLPGSPQVSQVSQFPGPQHQFGVPPQMMQYGGSMPNYSTNSQVLSGRPQGPWLSQSNIGPAGPSNILATMMHQQIPQPMLHPQAQALLQQQRFQALQGGIHRFPPMASTQVFNSFPPPVLGKYGENVMVGDSRDRNKQQRVKQNQRHLQQNSEVNSHLSRSNSGWPPFRSKYMSSEEIENIVRMQLAATHINDPYVDDYYHQAVQAKKSRVKNHFAPSTLRELPSRTRATAEPHAYLQVDALGRVPFSSIRRPRPLLEVDSGSLTDASGEGISEPKPTDRPLEQEPVVAARIVIEDCLCLLLDVDDIDRFLQVSRAPEGGVHLKRRRQLLLEGLASSLHLDDPPKDDLVFLRLVLLPKGRKLLSKYLQLLSPGNDLARIVSMAVFRHLRSLFRVVPADADAAATTNALARAVAYCVSVMDLHALIDCLGAVVQSTEQPPPLRPIGSSTGDGASVVVKAILERATKLFSDCRINYNESLKNLWQTYFNYFFSLLTKYCNSQYEYIMQSLLSAPGNADAINAAAAYAIGKELPVDLLYSCLPFINDEQRKDLLEFTKRPMHASGYNSPNRGHSNTASVPG